MSGLETPPEKQVFCSFFNFLCLGEGGSSVELRRAQLLIHLRLGARLLAGLELHPAMTGSGSRTGRRVWGLPVAVDGVPIFRPNVAFDE